VTIRFVDLRGSIIKALRAREPAIDILDVKTTGLRGTPDPALLEIAARQDRVLITYDRHTMTRHFCDRIHAGGQRQAYLLFPNRRALSAQSSSRCFFSGAHPKRRSWRNQIVYPPFR